MKEKLKVYHGLPKTPTTENTLFYASFDGSLIPEVHKGTIKKVGSERSFVPCVPGYGLGELNGSSEITYEIPEYSIDNLPEVVTLDFWTYYPGFPDKLVRMVYAMFCDVLVGESGYLYVGFWNNRAKVKVLEKGHYHFRLIIKPLNKTTGETDVTLYINGKYEGKYKTIISDVNSDDPIAIVSFGHAEDCFNCSISDVCVTLDDLGDYFPTLPQDFIDGKAIVVPALNQRQSYGDPVLHQVTELVVKNQPAEILGTIYDLNDRDADGLERCFTNPELRTAHAYSWAENYGKIRILGIDNTYITGVIDTDTARCRVTKDIATNVTTGTFTVDDTSKLVVGDLLWIYSSNIDNIWELNTAYYLEVKSVNHTTKEVTATTNRSTGFKVTVGDCLIETTASSSSPTVKTLDGHVVNGTWSGLGTNVATFTLGSNSGISGKDLVVTYCLNARGDVSPYPKMPSEVIRGYDELGNEMIPVTSVEIEDDFTGKIKGDTSTCFHTIKSYAASSLLAPSSSVGNEVSQDHYNKINNPGDFVTISTSSNNAKVQVRFDFDLFKMLEQKLGEEVSLSWVQNNVAHIKLNAICKGSSHMGAYVEARYYDPKNMEWKLNSSGYSNSTSSFAKISATYSGDLIRNKNTNCFFMVTCSSSDGNSSSFVQIKEVWVNVKLKTGDVYDVLYTKDTNARVSPCNPIIVDTQTKTVSRLIPSTKPFSTEVLMYNPTTTSSGGTFICKSAEGIISTQGSGSSAITSDIYRGLIGRMGLDSSPYTNDNVLALSYNGGSYFSRLPLKNFLRQGFCNSIYFNDISQEDMPETPTNFVAICPDLYLSNESELVLVTRTSKFINNIRDGYIFEGYKLPNRPLIK